MSIARKFASLVLIMALAIPLFLGMTPPILPEQDSNGRSFSVYVFRDSEWQLQGELSFTDYETLQLPLGNNSGQLKLRLVQKGHDSAYVDHVMLQKYGVDYLPASATNINSNGDVLAKILYPEYDVCNGWDSTLEIVWDSAPENATLIMRAMEEDLGEDHGYPLYYPWPYEQRTLSNLLVNDGGITVDGLLNEHTEPSFSVFWQPDSSHPDGYTYGWIHCDNVYLYAAVEVTPDNTADKEDWGALYVMVDGKLKEFRISQDQTWGVRGFGYTSSVLYEHRIYEFKIPLTEINAAVGSEIQYIFGAYGTAAVHAFPIVYVNGITGNDIFYDGSSPTVISGSIGPKKTIQAGIVATSDYGTVRVAAGIYTESICTSKPITIEGAGAQSTVIDGGGISAFNTVVVIGGHPDTEATISGFTIQNGYQDTGGGIFINSFHTLYLYDCIVKNNVASTAGGIFNNGTLHMERCTISGNSAQNQGGGIYNSNGQVWLTNCTISGNRGLEFDWCSGGGIYNKSTMTVLNCTIAYNSVEGVSISVGGGFTDESPTTMTFKNTIVANNTAGNDSYNNGYFSGGSVTSLGNNIDSENSCGFDQPTDQTNTNPLLGSLQNNGGPTYTHAITASSPAFNMGTNVGAPATDQRGIIRPQGASCDVGAFELEQGASAQVLTATGTGTATFSASTGSIIGLSAATTTPCGILPGISFTHGFFSFTITNIVPGSTITITITLPSNMPAGTQYWKCINGSWVNCTSLLGDNDGDNVLTLTITDGGLADADGIANGIIVDPGGPGIPVAPASSSSPQLPERFVTTPSRLTVKYLNVQPQQAQANQPVTIYANIANSGDESGNYTATLKINGQVEEIRTGRVGGHMAVPMKFEVLRTEPGVYLVDINGQQSHFTIAGEQSNAGSSKTILLIGLIICAICVVVVSVLLILRRRYT